MRWSFISFITLWRTCLPWYSVDIRCITVWPLQSESEARSQAGLKKKAYKYEWDSDNAEVLNELNTVWLQNAFLGRRKTKGKRKVDWPRQDVAYLVCNWKSSPCWVYQVFWKMMKYLRKHFNCANAFQFVERIRLNYFAGIVQARSEEDGLRGENTEDILALVIMRCV